VPHFFERAEPNALWQVDLIEDEPTAVGKVQGIFYLDDHSRTCVGGGFFADKREENVLAVGVEAVTENGLPVEVLSDNGSQFRPVGGAAVEGATSRYQQGWEALGVQVTFAAPDHPQTKGKEEKFHRFVQEDFLNEVRDQVTSLADLNARFQAWRQAYNTRWPHRALSFRPPHSRYRSGMAVDPATLWHAFAAEETRRVQLNGTIQVGQRFYPLPKGWERSRVRIYRLAGRLKVIGGKEDRLLGEWDT